MGDAGARLAAGPVAAAVRDPASREFVLPLPAELAHYGEVVRATLTGREGGPVVVMIGGISGNRHAALRADGGAGWWGGLAADGGAIDLRRYQVLGIDFIADESGRAAPGTADQAVVLAAVLDRLHIGQVHAIVGASYGGMVALAFAERFGGRVDRLVILCADAAPHPCSTAARELQRRVVRMGLVAGRGEEALAIARGMAMMTYRCPAEFAERFNGGIAGHDPLTCSEPGAYLRARGEAFCAVMSPQRFLSLSASIDRHRVEPERIATAALLIGAESDQLVYPGQMRALHERLAGPATLHLMASLYGHDMFLKDVDRFGPMVAEFLARPSHP